MSISIALNNVSSRKSITVGTHSGVFHADEVFACAALLLEWNLEITRTRNPVQLAECEFIVDVGGVFDPELKRFDHHQQGYHETREDGTPLSSFGLVWRHVIARKGWNDVLRHIDKSLVRLVDATDCGVSLHQGEAFTISHLVSSMNPGWDSDTREDEAFEEAVWFAFRVLERAIEKGESMGQAKAIVQDAIDHSWDMAPVLVLPRFCPWQEHLHECDPKGRFQAVAFQDRDGTWRVQGRPVEPGSFQTMLSHLEELRGLSGEELSEKAGIGGLVFVHKGGFIGGANSFGGAMELASLMS